MTDISKLITSDGMSVFMYTYGSSPDVTGGGFQNESYGAISVDINGFKGPNVFGQDMFHLYLQKKEFILLARRVQFKMKLLKTQV